MNLQDFCSPLHIRVVDLHLSVKSSWSQQSLVQIISSVGSSQNNHSCNIVDFMKKFKSYSLSNKKYGFKLGLKARMH